MRSIILTVTTLILVGCGGGDTYVANEPAIPEIPTGTGNALIVTATDDGSAGLKYTEIGDGSILIDCGTGGCGDVYIASPVDETITPSETNGSR